MLDVGTGPGEIAILLASRAGGIKVLAIDLGEHMLSMARDNVVKAGLGDRVEIARADAKETGQSSGAFDMVISNSLVHHIPEPREFLAEVKRVLKPGGGLFIKDLHRPATEGELGAAGGDVRRRMQPLPAPHLRGLAARGAHGRGGRRLVRRGRPDGGRGAAHLGSTLEHRAARAARDSRRTIREEEISMGLEFRIVKRDAIPAITSVEHDGVRHTLGELRDFRWSEALRAFMPDPAAFSVSWVALAHGETLAPHVHPIQSMMVVYAGSGRMLGDLNRAIAQGDVIVVPPGRLHGFTGGPEGLFALSIQFGEGLYTAPESPRVVFTAQQNSLEALLATNAKRALGFVDRPIFELLGDGTLENGRCFDACSSALELWRHGTRDLMLLRQVNSGDARYEAAFRPAAAAVVADRERPLERPGATQP